MINIGRYRIVSCGICTLYIIHIYLFTLLWNLNQGRINRGVTGSLPPLEFYLHQSKNQILQILIAHAPPTPPLQKGGGAGRGPSPPPTELASCAPAKWS